MTQELYDKLFQELRAFSAIETPDPFQKKYLNDLIGVTRQIDEHPEDYDGPCECQTCMSYAD